MTDKQMNTLNEWLNYKINLINESTEDENNIITIGNKKMTIKEYKELERKCSANMQNVTKMNLLVFYDDILQYLGFGFMHYLVNINKTNEIFTDKQKKRLPTDIYKFFRRKDYDIFTMMQKMFKFPEETILKLYGMYKQLYAWLMKISPVSKLFNDFIKLGKVLQTYTIVFQFNFDGMEKYGSLIENEIRSMNKSSMVRVNAVSLEKKPRNKIYETFFDTNEKEGHVVFEMEGFPFIEYIIDNNIFQSMLCVPRVHNGLDKDFINLSLYENIVSDNELFGKINETAIQIFDEYVAGYELQDANMSIQ